MNKRPWVLVGGGTGGHIYPLVAIGEALKKADQNFIYIGSNGKEKPIIEKLGFDFREISAGKLRRHPSFKDFFVNLHDIWLFAKGFFQSLKILRIERPEAVISKGGYVSLPVVLAASMLKVPVYIHESDAVMGASNLFALRFARKVFTAFDVTVYKNKTDKFIKVGIPIRQSLRHAVELKVPKKVRPIILIIGGIQGSRAINNMIKTIAPELIEIADIVHITGEKDYEDIKAFASQLSHNKGIYKAFAFVDRELSYYYQVADIMISRASATVLSEAAIFGKALYLIPLPSASANHQLINAKIFEAQKAAILRQEYQLNPEVMLNDLKGLLENPEKTKMLGDNLRSYFGEIDSTKNIIEIVRKDLDNG